MVDISIKHVGRILDLSVPRIEQWISREQFRQVTSLGRGKKRVWDEQSIIRLAVFASLVDDIGISPDAAGKITDSYLHGFHNDGAFFVCYKVMDPFGLPIWMSEIVMKSEVGDFLLKKCSGPRLVEPTQRGGEVSDFDQESVCAELAVILDLDKIEKAVIDGMKKFQIG